MKRIIDLEPTLERLRGLAADIPFERVISWVYAAKDAPEVKPKNAWQRFWARWQA